MDNRNSWKLNFTLSVLQGLVVIVILILSGFLIDTLGNYLNTVMHRDWYVVTLTFVLVVFVSLFEEL